MSKEIKILYNKFSLYKGENLDLKEQLENLLKVENLNYKKDNEDIVLLKNKINNKKKKIMQLKLDTKNELEYKENIISKLREDCHKYSENMLNLENQLNGNNKEI
jgi:hypothetical protein